MKKREKKESPNFVNKKKLVAEIEANLKEAKSVIFMDYRGITVSEVTALRDKFRAADVKYKVYKNTLIRRALNNMGIGGLDSHLTGTLSVAFSNRDEITAAKIVQDEKLKNKMAFKFGLLGTTVLSEGEVSRLATMPSKEQLVAQLIGLLQHGARGIATTVNAVPRNMAMVINARASLVHTTMGSDCPLCN